MAISNSIKVVALHDFRDYDERCKDGLLQTAISLHFSV